MHGVISQKIVLFREVNDRIPTESLRLSVSKPSKNKFDLRRGGNVSRKTNFDPRGLQFGITFSWLMFIHSLLGSVYICFLLIVDDRSIS
jgi:hypothetical protein